MHEAFHYSGKVFKKQMVQQYEFLPGGIWFNKVQAVRKINNNHHHHHPRHQHAQKIPAQTAISMTYVQTQDVLGMIQYLQTVQFLGVHQ